MVCGDMVGDVVFCRWSVGMGTLIVQSSNNLKKENYWTTKDHQSGKRLKEVFPVLATAVQLLPSNVGRLLDGLLSEILGGPWGKKSSPPIALGFYCVVTVLPLSTL